MEEFWTFSDGAIGPSYYAMRRLLQILEVCFDIMEVCFDIIFIFQST